MPKADVTVDIFYNANTSRFVIKTNARKERVADILDDYLEAQTGKGADHSEPNKKSEYHITIKLDLSDDTFYVTSDTGNYSLTCGIVLYALTAVELKEANIEDL
jgi:hypothetical protein